MVVALALFAPAAPLAWAQPEAGLQMDARLLTPQTTEIAFEGSGGFKLTGELMMPAGMSGRPFAAVLLLPGSGPTDRDGNQGPAMTTDLLKQTAERFAEAGIASFRFDKRAVARYQQQWPISDLEQLNELFAFNHFVGDAAAALRVLREREEIDAERIGIVGHSEGGLIALSIASRLRQTDDAPETLILLATAGRTLDVLLREQITRQVGGEDSPMAEQIMPALDQAIQAVKAQEPMPDDLPPGLAQLFNPTVMSIMYSYFTIDPAELAGEIDGDVLVLQGAADVQVSASRDAPRLLQALAGREQGAVEVVIVPGVSHNLKPLKGAADPGFGGPVSQKVLATMTEWVGQRLVDNEQ